MPHEEGEHAERAGASRLEPAAGWPGASVRALGVDGDGHGVTLRAAARWPRAGRRGRRSAGRRRRSRRRSLGRSRAMTAWPTSSLRAQPPNAPLGTCACRRSRRTLTTTSMCRPPNCGVDDLGRERTRCRRARRRPPASATGRPGGCGRRPSRRSASARGGRRRRLCPANIQPCRRAIERQAVGHADEAGDVLGGGLLEDVLRACRPARSCPARMIARRSPSASASLWSWVTNTAVNRSRAWSSWSWARTWSRSRASRLLSGSSNSTRSGRATRPRASATRCCWPPLSCAGIAVEQLPSSRPARRSPRPSPASPGRLSLRAFERVADVLAHGHVRPQRVGLEHHADVALVRAQVHAWSTSRTRRGRRT